MSHLLGNLIVLRKNNISLAATGTTTLFTPSARFMPLMVQIVVRSASGVLTPATVSIGVNAAAYADIIAATALSSSLLANAMINAPITLAMQSVPSGTAIVLNCSVAVNLGGAQSIDVILLGTNQ